MSLPPGGRADKFGNRFERLWVVSLALDVIEGRLSTMKWEPLGVEGEGVECVVTQTDRLKIYHQCKIQNGNHGKWSVAVLGKNGVLHNAKEKLEADPRCKFAFIANAEAIGWTVVPQAQAEQHRGVAPTSSPAEPCPVPPFFSSTYWTPRFAHSTPATPNSQAT